MTTPVENFINNELPKRPYTNDASSAWNVAGKVLVTTGTALGVTQGSINISNLATVTYVNGLVLGLWDDRGAYTVNAAGNIDYPSSAGSGVAGALMKGDIFTVTGAVAGVSTINNIAVNTGDTVRALIDAPSTTNDAHWAIAESNIGYVPENTANKTTNTDLSGVAGTYPDTPTVKSYIDNYDISAASISSTGTVTLNRTESDLTFQVPTAISGLSFDPNTGILTSSYTNNATSTTITVAANEVSDNVFRIKDNDDATKKIAFEASGIAAGETRTITMPNSDVDLGNVAQAASTSTAGYLTSADWNTFNTKEQGGYITVSSNFTAEVGKKYRTVRGLNSAITITPPVTTVDGAYFTVFYTYMTSTGSVTCTNPNISASQINSWQEYEYTYDAAGGNWMHLRKSLGPIVPAGSNFQLRHPTNFNSFCTFQLADAISSTVINVPAGINIDLGLIGKSDFADNMFRVSDALDSTKKIAFEASPVGTGQVRTITMPNADVNLTSVAGMHKSAGLKTVTKQFYTTFPNGVTTQKYLTTDGSSPSFVPPADPFLFIPLPDDGNTARPVLVNIKGIGYSTNLPAGGTWVFQRRIIVGRGTENGVDSYGGVPRLETVSDFTYGQFNGAVFMARTMDNASIIGSSRVLQLAAQLPNNNMGYNCVVRVIAEIIYSEDTIPDSWL